MNRLALFSIMAVLTFSIYSANATVQTEKYPVIMVVQSEICQKMIQNHINSTCATDDKTMKYDTSNQHISGKFVTKDGITTRTKAQVTNHYQFYTKQTVCVDCTGNLFNPDLYKIILLEPHGFTFVNKDQVVPNNKWYSYSDRSMQGCNTATIAYSDALLNDTISFLESGCTKTSFNGTMNHIIKEQPWSWDNPYSSLHQKSIVDKVKSTGGLGNCISKQCDYTDPYKKAGW